ncbi:MAG TPA: hypothetical protein DDX29_11180 [Clostridiales bacterium]|nr:hypothetical protein [Clostridiales bacterium]
MLESCLHLRDCEDILSEYISHVALLGEIPLSKKDIDLLKSLIKRITANDLSHGAQLLKRHYSYSLSFFLMEMGRLYDKELGYWPIVEKYLGSLEANHQRYFGDIFLTVLQKNKLPLFDEEEGLTYVTPILCHACIPNQCFPEYFEGVIIPLIQRDLMDPSDDSEIIHDLHIIRKNQFHRLKFEKQRDDKQSQINEKKHFIEKIRNKITKLEQITKLLDQESVLAQKEKTIQGILDLTGRYEELNSEIVKASKKIKNLDSNKNSSEGEIEKYQNRLKEISRKRRAIDEYRHIILEFNKLKESNRKREGEINKKLFIYWEEKSSEFWNDELGSKLLSVNLDKLLTLITNYQEASNSFNKQNSRKKRNKDSLIVLNEKNNFFQKLLDLWQKIRMWVNQDSFIYMDNSRQYSQEDERKQGEIIQLRKQVKDILSGLIGNDDLLDNPDMNLYRFINDSRELYLELRNIDDQEQNIREEIDQETRIIINLFPKHEQKISENTQQSIRIIYLELENARQENLSRRDQEILKLNTIKENISFLREEIADYFREQDELEEKLHSLGYSCIVEAMQLVQQYRNEKKQLEKMRLGLEEEYSDLIAEKNKFSEFRLESIESEYQQEISQKITEINEIQVEIEKINKDIENYPKGFFGIDEPIRKFLLYGGEVSENFLIKSIKLFNAKLSGQDLNKDVINSIPTRLVNHFIIWWDQNLKRTKEITGTNETKVVDSGEKFSSPYLYFDPILSGIFLYFPSQVLAAPKTNYDYLIEIKSSKGINILKQDLKLFQRQNNLVESESIDSILLSEPAEYYSVILNSKNNRIKEWTVKGVDSDTLLIAFSMKNYKRLDNNTLPRDQVIILTRRFHSLVPENSLLTEKIPLMGEWNQWFWQEVDLSNIDELEIIKNDKKIHSLLIQDDLTSKIRLVGGSVLKNIFGFRGQRVYNIPPSEINIPISENDDIHLFKISLIHDGLNGGAQRTHYQADELLDKSIKTNGHIFRLPLSDDRLLGVNPVGNYTLRVYKRPYVDWNLSFIIVPSLEVSFDKAFYLPYQKENQRIFAKLKLNCDTNFSPDYPASITQSDRSLATILTNLAQKAITGTLSINTEGKKVSGVSILIPIPKVRWRFVREDGNINQWCDQSKDEELWLRDWFSAARNLLHIEIPDTCRPKVFLKLKENSKTMAPIEIKSNIHSFDLKTLEDVLRKGPSLEYFDLVLDLANETFSTTLFRIRTRWEAKKIIAYFIPGDREDRIDVSWEEPGKPCEKSASLWLIKDKKELLQRKLVSQEDSETSFIFSSGKITSGKYQICLEVNDPWQQVNIVPKDNLANSLIFEIFIDPQGKVMEIESIVETYRYTFPQNMYRIRIISQIKNQQIPKNCDIDNLGDVLITPINENWYVGILEVKDQPRVLAHLDDTNPVKLEYDPEKKAVTSIEDRHGDGAMYCFECNMLFWCQETLLEEKYMKHRSYGPIEQFHIEWIEEDL